MSDTALKQNVDDTTSQGILYLVLGLIVFSVQDVIMKFFSDQIALQEVIFLRGVVTLMIISPIMFYLQGRSAFVSKQPVWAFLRGFAGFLCFSLFSMALAVLPLADAMPLYYTSPLFVVALSIPFLGEKVGLRSWLAIFVGFGGVILVAQPGSSGIEPAMILALLSAVAYSAQSLLARKLGSTESALGMTFYSQLAFIALSGIVGLTLGSGWMDEISHPSAQYLLRAWSVPTLTQIGLIIALGFISAAGFFCISQAYRLGRANAVAPFEYSSLPFAVLWGWLFWGAIPTSTTVMGSLLIVASGLYILHREVVRRRQEKQKNIA
ncbi:DMT family transporter [Curvivirga sp.]|uniref:DMT family transporter n=1 Tax=Curvivirga sp. TaxID=2856848 RepID=UPI003B5A4264